MFNKLRDKKILRFSFDSPLYYLAHTCIGTVPVHAKQNKPHGDGIQFGSRNKRYF